MNLTYDFQNAIFNFGQSSLLNPSFVTSRSHGITALGMAHCHHTSNELVNGITVFLNVFFLVEGANY